jgi:hypothetical protein
MVKPSKFTRFAYYTVIIKDKFSGLISRMSVTANGITDALEQARQEKGDTHEIISAVLR